MVNAFITIALETQAASLARIGFGCFPTMEVYEDNLALKVSPAGGCLKGSEYIY